jgi:Antitoxin ParD
MAALQGKTIKEFVLASTLGAAKPDEVQALTELKALLDARLLRAKTEGYSTRSAEEILEEGVAEANHRADA